MIRDPATRQSSIPRTRQESAPAASPAAHRNSAVRSRAPRWARARSARLLLPVQHGDRGKVVPLRDRPLHPLPTDGLRAPLPAGRPTHRPPTVRPHTGLLRSALAVSVARSQVGPSRPNVAIHCSRASSMLSAIRWAMLVCSPRVTRHTLLPPRSVLRAPGVHCRWCHPAPRESSWRRPTRRTGTHTRQAVSTVRLGCW